MRTESRPLFLPALCGLTVKHPGQPNPGSLRNAAFFMMDGILELCLETPLVLLQALRTGTDRNEDRNQSRCSGLRMLTWMLSGPCVGGFEVRVSGMP